MTLQPSDLLLQRFPSVRKVPGLRNVPVSRFLFDHSWTVEQNMIRGSCCTWFLSSPQASDLDSAQTIRLVSATRGRNSSKDGELFSLTSPAHLLKPQVCSDPKHQVTLQFGLKTTALQIQHWVISPNQHQDLPGRGPEPEYPDRDLLQGNEVLEKDLVLHETIQIYNDVGMFSCGTWR